MGKANFLAAALFAIVLVPYVPAQAQDWHRGDMHGPGDWHDHGGWHGHDWHGPGSPVYDHWRGGRWINDFHDGRSGWWWVVDGGWYFYPAPVYPYPDPYVPPAAVIESSPAPADMQSYYYCGNPAGYYPDVPQCAMQWQKVVVPVNTAPPVTPGAALSAPPLQQVAPSASAPAPVSQQDRDYQRLNDYAAQARAVAAQDPRGRAKLKTLAGRLAKFRRELVTRSYNPIDILKNADDLKRRIVEKRAALNAPSATVATPLYPGQ